MISLMQERANNRINSDWQFRCASLPAGYAERYVQKQNVYEVIEWRPKKLSTSWKSLNKL